MDKNCMTCRFYTPDPKLKKRYNGIGVCHRYPRLHLQNSNCYYVDVIEKDDWCGEWQMNDDHITSMEI